MATGGAVTVAIAAAIANAIKASGAIVQVEPRDFLTIVSKTKTPLVVMTVGGVFKKNYQYLTAYKGLIFFTKSDAPLGLPSDAELVSAGKIWVPS
jgi:hypothetical protein